MAARQEKLTGKDLDDLYDLLDNGFLDEDVDFEKDLAALVIAESQEANFCCDECSKVCKTQRGLTRHKNIKHTSSRSCSGVPVSSETIIEKKLHADVLLRIINECAESCFNDLCLPQESRDFFSKKNFVFTSEDSLQLLQKLKYIVEDFSGDAEKFYSGFYGLLLDNLLPSKFEDETVTNILMTEAANHILIHLSGGSDIVSLQPPSKKLEHVHADRDFKSLQYIAGYIVHKMYTKFKFSNKYKSDHRQQTLSILKACKVEHDDSQTLVNLNDRGGLWKVNKEMQGIFIECENIFRARTSTFQTSIDSTSLVSEMLQNCHVVSSYRLICYGVEPKVPNEICFNILEKMLMLFTRVRTFSYAKDICEKYKSKKKHAKKSSLRTAIKKASSSTDMGH